MKQKLTAVVVDDEKHCRESLIKQLEWSCPEVNVVGQASNAEQAKHLLSTSKPDILFLDIEMPGGTGFDLIRALKNITYSIIFTTAYDAFALDAFKANAIDYLLKPIDGDALSNAVAKVQKMKPATENTNLELLLQQIQGGKSKKQVAFPVSDGLTFVDTDDIIRCESEGAYCHIFIRGQPKLFLSKTLKQISELINHDNFLRVHHSHLINSNFIKRYIRGKGGQIILEDGTSIPVSRSRKDDFLQQFQDRF